MLLNSKAGIIFVAALAAVAPVLGQVSSGPPSWSTVVSGADLDGNNAINFTELSTWRMLVYNSTMSLQDFNQSDTDRDGFLVENEWNALLSYSMGTSLSPLDVEASSLPQGFEAVPRQSSSAYLSMRAANNKRMEDYQNQYRSQLADRMSAKKRRDQESRDLDGRRRQEHSDINRHNDDQRRARQSTVEYNINLTKHERFESGMQEQLRISNQAGKREQSRNFSKFVSQANEFVETMQQVAAENATGTLQSQLGASKSDASSAQLAAESKRRDALNEQERIRQSKALNDSVYKGYKSAADDAFREEMKSKKDQAEAAAEDLRQQRVRRDANATAMRNEQLERDVRSDEKKAAQDSQREQEIFTREREKSDAALEQVRSDYSAMERIEDTRRQAQAARNHNHTLTLAQQTQSFDSLKQSQEISAKRNQTESDEARLEAATFEAGRQAVREQQRAWDQNRRADAKSQRESDRKNRDQAKRLEISRAQCIRRGGDNTTCSL